MRLNNPNKNNPLNNNPPLREYWIEDSALYYEQYSKRGSVYFKYTIENNELVKFSRLNGKFLPVILVLFLIHFLKLSIQLIIQEPTVKNIGITAILVAIIFLVFTRNFFVKRKMKKIWNEKRNLITQK